MKTNKQSKIKIKNSGFKRSRFNWSHDVNTTHTWGEIQPTQCKLLIPGSKTTMSTQDLIRLAPMVAPTFGRVKYKTFNQFVACAEVFPNWDAFMAQEPVTKVGGTKVPTEIPFITLGELSAYCLFGAKASIYWTPDPNDTGKTQADLGIYRKEYKQANGTLTATQTAKRALLLQSGKLIFSAISEPLNNVAPDAGSIGTRVVMYPSLMDGHMSSTFGGEPAGKRTRIPLGFKSINDLFDYDPSLGEEWINENVPDVAQEVTMSSADYVIEFTVTDASNNINYFALAVELSDYGKRIRKIIQGCGYQIDFSSGQNVSILPLLAQYKAYFDDEFDLSDLTLTQEYASPNTNIYSNANETETTKGIKMHHWEISADNLDFMLEFYTVSPNPGSWYILGLGITLVVTFLVWGAIRRKNQQD